MNATFRGIRAVVFDAYGTLFDVGSAARRFRQALGDRWEPIADTWRAKQLQYTWLRTLMGRHADFWQVTGDALDFALDAHGIRPAGVRDRLMELYRSLDAYADARPALARLRDGRIARAILSNGEPGMLAAAAHAAGLAELLDEILSVEDVGAYKPRPEVYGLAARRLGTAPLEILFVSSNGWDAHGAKAFGFRVAWCNRSGAPRERLPGDPDAIVDSLAGVPAILGLS